ncbi:MAG: sugar transferase [Ilumatobacteraceae bacterium]
MSAVDGIRRAADVVAACIGLMLMAPVLAMLAVAIGVTDGGSVFFRQRRLGLGGRPFELLKFRTMRPATAGRAHPDHDGDRVTRLGGWMRALSIDELPSLINLLRGDVSLVGPRPLPVHYWSRFRGDEYIRFETRPGITGLAQVSGRNLVSWDERLALDTEYVRTRSLLGDLRILGRTVPAILGRTGINAEGAATMTELPADR